MSKPNQLLDAVKTATAIHEGDYSSLRGKSFVIHDNIEKKKNHHGEKTVKKPTLSQKFDTLSQRFDTLSQRFDTLNQRMDRLEIKVDQLSMTVEKLAKIVSDGFKQVNTRIDRIDARLDYIVKANNLKDSK